MQHDRAEMRPGTLVRLFFLLAFLATGSVLARDVPEPVYPLRDDYGLLDEKTAEAVRTVCFDLERQTTAEMAVLIIGTTAGENHHDYAVRVYNAWGVGKEGKNNGVLLLFCMDDRRMELVPGDGYRKLFTRSLSQDLLTEHAVPHMKAGQPAKGVLAACEQVAERIRYQEATNPPPEDLSQGLGGTSSHRKRSSRPHGGMLVLFLLWAGLVIVTLNKAFGQGVLLMSKGLIYLIIYGGAAVIAGLAFVLYKSDPLTTDLVSGGGSVVGVVIFSFLASHICPKCNRWMSISKRTITSATHWSKGTGEKTCHCQHCQYHKVTTYTISKKTRSSSSGSSYSSSSSSSSSRSGSFGGGYSSGGGGGASW